MVRNTEEESTVMTGDISSLVYAEIQGIGRTDVPEEVATHRGQLEARTSNLGLHQESSSSNLSTEMMAMTRALFSSLETRVARLEASNSHKNDIESSLQNRLTSLETRLERKLTEAAEASTETTKSLELRTVSAEKDLSERITKLEQQGDLEERMSRLEGSVASLNASFLQKERLMQEKLAAFQKQMESRLLAHEEDVLSRLKRRLDDERMEEPSKQTMPANSTDAATTSKIVSRTEEDDKNISLLLEHLKQLGQASRQQKVQKVAKPASVAIPQQPDESVFPQRCAIVLKDHRSCVLRRGRHGKLIAPHPKSPASGNVPEQLLFCFDEKHGGFLVHSLKDRKRLVLSIDGILRFEVAKSQPPTSRELFFVVPKPGYLLFGCLHTKSFVCTHDELCNSKPIGLQSPPEKAKFRISRRIKCRAA